WRVDGPVRRDDRRVAIAEPPILLVIALHRLHRMRVCARRQEKRYNQHERIESQPAQTGEPESPDGGQYSRKEGDPYSLPTPELEPEDRDHRRDGRAEYPFQLRQERQEGRVEDGKAGDVDLGVAVLLVTDDLADLGPHPTEVVVLLPEAREDEGRLVVRGNKEAAYALGRIDLLAQEGEVLLILWQTRV